MVLFENKAVNKRTEPLFVSALRSQLIVAKDLHWSVTLQFLLSPIADSCLSSVASLKSASQEHEILNEDANSVRLLRHEIEDANFILMCVLLPNLE